MEATNDLNYDAYHARAIAIFNDRMGADFSEDNIILTCFMTEDQKEIFEQFCSKYFPYRLNDRYQEEGYFDFRASSFIGMDNGGKDGIMLRTTYPINRWNCSISSCMSWRTSTALTTNWTGRASMTNTVKTTRRPRKKTASSTRGTLFGGSVLQRLSPLSLTIAA